MGADGRYLSKWTGPNGLDAVLGFSKSLCTTLQSSD